MKLEVLVSTMNRSDASFTDEMNICTDAVVVNQANCRDCKEIKKGSRNILFLTFPERGLSVSRNRLLENARGDICIIADDDVIYKGDYEEIVTEAHCKYPDFAIIVFQVPSTGLEYAKRFSPRQYKAGYLRSMKVASCQITFKRDMVIKTGVCFDTMFGAGSKYSCGEENIFLFDCLKRGLEIMYIPKVIGKVIHGESTWFKGYNEKYFRDVGAVYHAMFGFLTIPFILQFVVRKYKRYKKSTSIMLALKYMLIGMHQHKMEIRRLRKNEK